MSKELIRRILREADSTITAGAYSGPLGLGLKKWDKSELGPFTQELSHFTNAENYADSLDGNMDKSKTEIHRLEIIGDRWAKKLKDKFKQQDDDMGESPNDGEVDGDTINEDLAVWFGKKKKKKGSSQPQGPWVNICRKKEGGGHPPCGRGEAKSKGYPKCRALGVARKMTDAQKKAACQQKRKAEKKDPKTGKGNAPTMVSYKPKKKVKENSLRNLIKLTLTEMTNDNNICNKIIFEFYKPVRKKWAQKEVCVPDDVNEDLIKYIEVRSGGKVEDHPIPKNLLDYIYEYYKNSYYFLPGEIKISTINWAHTRDGEKVPKVSIEFRISN